MHYKHIQAIRALNCIYIRDLWGLGLFDLKYVSTVTVNMVTGPIIAERWHQGNRIALKTRRHHSYIYVHMFKNIKAYETWRFICPKCNRDRLETLYMTFPIDNEPNYNWLCRHCLDVRIDPYLTRTRPHSSRWWRSQALKVKHGGMPGIGHPWPMQPRYPWWQKTFQNDMERGMLWELESWKLLGEAIVKRKKRCTS